MCLEACPRVVIYVLGGLFSGCYICAERSVLGLLYMSWEVCPRVVIYVLGGLSSGCYICAGRLVLGLYIKFVGSRLNTMKLLNSM